MWEPEEQERYETAVIRSMTDANAPATRLYAMALCWVIATPRLLSAAQRVASAGILPAMDVAALEIASAPLRARIAAGRRLRGNVLSVELLLASYVSSHDERAVDATLDWIDVRDLVAVARTTMDARLFGEIERRIQRRGKYQRGRAANLLGFSVRLRAAAHGGGDTLFHSPIFGG